MARQKHPFQIGFWAPTSLRDATPNPRFANDKSTAKLPRVNENPRHKHKLRTGYRRIFCDPDRVALSRNQKRAEERKHSESKRQATRRHRREAG